MIFTDRTITVRKGESRIDEPIVVYRGDYELEVRFTILNSRFKFMSGTNMIESEKASYGQLAILTPYGGNIFSDIVRCNDGSVTFVLTAEMLNQIEEVGLYSFQIRLMDYNKESRVSIPPIEFGIEVREPIASEDHDNSVNNAIVGYSIAKVVDPKEEKVGDTFDGSGNYNKTKWETGDRISEGKLNKIEDAIDKVNKNEVNNTATLSKRIDNNFNVLDSIIESELAQTNAQLSNVENTSIKRGESSVIDMNMLSQSVKEAMTGGSVPVVGANSVGMVNLQQSATTPDKILGTEFINWLDRSKLQVNKYLNINTNVHTGEITESWRNDSYYGVTDYIPVVNGDFICIKGRGGSNYGDIIALYNHELKPCGKVTYSEAEGLGSNIYKYTINNESASYCRINCLYATTTTSEIMVVKNMDYPSEYIEYGLSKIKWLDLSDYAKKETLDDTMTRVDGLKKKVDGKAIQPYEIEGAKVVNFLNTKTMLVGQKINVSYDASTGIYTESIVNDQYVNVSDYVPVKKGDVIRQKDGYDVNKWNVLSVLYDDNFKCIGRISKTDLTKGANNVWTYEITDEKVKYIRANMAPSTGGNMLIINSEYPSDFIGYGITTLPWLSIPISGASGGNTMFVKKNGTETLVKWKYNATHDMVITIKPGGANKFPTFNGNKLIINSDSSVNADFDTVDLQLATGATDWIAPYNGLNAVNNGDTDVTGHNGWVGGWHGLNNLGGNPTGKNYVYDVYADNKLITNDGIYGATEVKIVTVNKIQGGNTIKQDGNGREIMQETVIYTLTPSNMKVETHIRALEDLTINCWYGYQTHNVAYADQIIFIGDNKLNYWHDILAGNNEYCGNKVDSDCNQVVMTKDNHYLECYIDNTFGAGKLRYLPNDKQVCRLYKVSGPGHPNSKCYFQIIDGDISLTEGQQLSIRGGYKFYYLENGIDTIY